jgi:hypothetical protein
VILVDDGLATGATMQAAVEAVRPTPARTHRRGGSDRIARARLLTQPIGETQRDLLQGFNQHIVVERAMELWLFRHRWMWG